MQPGPFARQSACFSRARRPSIHPALFLFFFKKKIIALISAPVYISCFVHSRRLLSLQTDPRLEPAISPFASLFNFRFLHSPLLFLLPVALNSLVEQEAASNLSWFRFSTPDRRLLFSGYYYYYRGPFCFLGSSLTPSQPLHALYCFQSPEAKAKARLYEST